MYDLGFGFPKAVLEVLEMMYTPRLGINVMDLQYCAYDGKPELIRHIQKLTGKKHVIITNGCTQAINICLRALKRAEGYNSVLTNQYTFSYYLNMIEKAGLNHVKVNDVSTHNNFDKALKLIDMPSNPFGQIHNIVDLYNNTIWDSVYNNKVYINDLTPFTVQARVEVGSVSKLFGVTGVRIGFIATNIESDFNLFYDEVKYENCTLSVLSQDLVIDIFDKLDMDKFMTVAQNRVNCNRDEFMKLNSFFDNQEVAENGMFHVVNVDNKGIDIIDKAGVEYITLDTERNNKLIRFNLAQNNTITKQAIQAIISTDRIK